MFCSIKFPISFVNITTQCSYSTDYRDFSIITILRNVTSNSISSIARVHSFYSDFTYLFSRHTFTRFDSAKFS